MGIYGSCSSSLWGEIEWMLIRGQDLTICGLYLDSFVVEISLYSSFVGYVLRSWHLGDLGIR